MRLGIVAAFVCLPGAAMAQSTNEVWPELDILWRPAVHQRTFLELSSSAEQESSEREDSIGLYQDYLWLPGGFARAGYRFTFSARDASYRESRALAEVNLGHEPSSMTRLVNRTRVELRWVNGEYSYRVRDRVHAQWGWQQPRPSPLTPYVTVEAYYDSRYNSIARLAGRAGNEWRFRGHTTLDLYVARQNNSRSAPQYVNALGVKLELSY